MRGARRALFAAGALALGAVWAGAPQNKGSAPADNRSVGIVEARYVVKPGDTLASVAGRLRMSPHELQRQLRKPLRPGQTLHITPPSRPRDDADPARDWIEGYPVQDGETLEQIARKLSVSLEELGDFNDLAVEYDARPGDTLAGIARRHDTTVQRLSDWNELGRNDPVFPGMKLVVGWEAAQAGETLYYPLRARAVEAVETELRAANGQYADGSAKLLSENTRYAIHTVEPGETVERIARRRGCGADDVRQINGMADDEQPRPGEPLYVPQRATKPQKEAPAPPGTTRQRLPPGQIPVRAGLVVARSAPILEQPKGSQTSRVAKGAGLVVVGTWGDGYAILMQGGRYGWVSRASVQLGDYIGSTRLTTPLPPDADRLIKIAYTYLGVPYVFGGNSYKGIDCSAFVKNVFVAGGRWSSGAPRTARDQINIGTAVSPEQLRPGDRVYFDTARLGYGVADHTGIYIGGGQLIHACSGRGVCVMNLFSGRIWRIYMTARR
jgi:cell wall-associated NlpC family hydrolase/transposase-like protein